MTFNISNIFNDCKYYINSGKTCAFYGYRFSSKGIILLVGVTFCIKAIAQRQLMIQSEYKVHSFLFCYIG